MWDFLSANPLFFIIGLGCLIPVCSIIFGSITNYLLKVRQAELDAGLKHEMVQRGMSADEIVRVLEARSGGSKKNPSEPVTAR